MEPGIFTKNLLALVATVGVGAVVGLLILIDEWRNRDLDAPENRKEEGDDAD